MIIKCDRVEIISKVQPSEASIFNQRLHFRFRIIDDEGSYNGQMCQDISLAKEEGMRSRRLRRQICAIAQRQITAYFAGEDEQEPNIFCENEECASETLPYWTEVTGMKADQSGAIGPNV